MEKYFIYARKSSEDDSRQVQSIPDQIEVMTKKAKALWLKVVETFHEEMSAKSPGRPVFDEMMKRVKKWEVTWIIAWKLDRLSRNPIDSGMLQYMLQTWDLTVIITNDRNYIDVDAWLLFSVESWIWNQYIMDLRKNVKRGLDYKANRWEWGCMAPEWYLNVDGLIAKDPERFELIKQMWKMMATWNYTVRQIMNIANEDWQFRRRKKKKLWWTKLVMSGMYRMFNNIFYTWDFMWNWEIKKWKHAPMISYEEFYRVQEMLWDKWIYILAQKREFAFTWFMTCWECWSAITATNRTKTLKDTWIERNYIYYHCTKRRNGCETCSQKPITLENLENQIDNILQGLELMPEFKEIWLEILKNNFEYDMKTKEAQKKQLQLSLTGSERQLKKLTEALILELIDNEEYKISKKQVLIDINMCKERISRLNAENDTSIEDTERVFDFIVNARSRFNHWNLQTKKEIFRTIGLNWKLKDWKLHWDVFPWFEHVQKFTSKDMSKKGPLELIKKSNSTPNTDAQNSTILVWSKTVNAVRNSILEHWERIYLPDFTENNLICSKKSV